MDHGFENKEKQSW